MPPAARQQVRLALDQIRRHRAVRLSAPKLEALLEATRQVAASLDRATTLSSILDILLGLGGADFAAVVLLDADGMTLRHEAARGPYADLSEGIEIPLGEGLTGICAQTGEVLNVPDLAGEPRYRERPVSRAAGMRSGLLIPLRGHERVIGVLVALSRQRAYFTAAREQMLLALAEQAARAIEHVQEVAERKRAEAALRASEERFRSLIENASDLITILDAAGTIIYESPALERILGYQPTELIGCNASAYLHPDDHARLSERFGGQLPGPDATATLEVRCRHQDGSWRTLECTVKDLTGDPAVGGIVVNARDVTERKRWEQMLEHHALHDRLTGLPNRTLLHDRLRQAILTGQRDGRTLALLIMDLDRFKDVNDTFGHHYGDALLRQIAPRLRGALREADTIARLGGDEFAILLPDTDRAGAMYVARKLLRALEAPFPLELAGFARSLDVAASIGIALCPEHGADADTLLRRADVAMYVAKRAQSGCALYAAEQDQHSPSRLTLMSELRLAIERDQLHLLFQPQVEMRTGRLVRAEALVRWRHPQHGLLTPDRFISLAEHAGLIKPLSRWVLNAALAQCRAWRDAGLAVPIAVNLSMRNLQDPDMPDAVAELLQSWDVEPGCLKVEITESSLVADPERAMASLTRLQAMGVSTAIDDFGTGYSSLAYLKRLPVDELKIDRAFVLHMADDEDDSAIVRSTIGLGHDLGLQVTAEGVETGATWKLLTRLGCDVAQGHFVGAPMPAAGLAGWLAERPSHLTGPGPALRRRP